MSYTFDELDWANCVCDELERSCGTRPDLDAMLDEMYGDLDAPPPGDWPPTCHLCGKSMGEEIGFNHQGCEVYEQWAADQQPGKDVEF